jgi:methylenetetrahydrofolate--tRNA-(uracil-5-)-methyltransferase
MHRNTFISSPKLLLSSLQSRQRENLFFAGQITGVEGYMGNIATGLLAGINAARLISGTTPLQLSRDTMLGALCYYITNIDLKNFQPMKANFGILPPLENVNPKNNKRERADLYAKRAILSMEEFLENEIQ